jgi:hypothetical protein
MSDDLEFLADGNSEGESEEDYEDEEEAAEAEERINAYLRGETEGKGSSKGRASGDIEDLPFGENLTGKGRKPLFDKKKGNLGKKKVKKNVEREMEYEETETNANG